MKEKEFRRAVRQGLEDEKRAGFGGLLILFEALIIGVLVYFFLKEKPFFIDQTWGAVISGLFTLLLFGIPVIRKIAIFTFSGVWAVLAYGLTAGTISENSDSAAYVGSTLLSTSPWPYLVGLVILGVSYGLHTSALD